ncbi:hypothetical protein ACHAXT_008653 [Thalassiosira profunda]
MCALIAPLLLLSLPLRSIAFAPAARPNVVGGVAPGGLQASLPTAIATGRPSPSQLMAKKRRRRKDASPVTTGQSDELPDFDDAEDDASGAADAAKVAEPARAVSPPPLASIARVTPVKRGTGLDASLAEQAGGNVDGLDEDTILEAMRGKAGGSNWLPPRSMDETLRDRSLEKFMDFDKMIERDGSADDVVTDLPDFDEVIARRKRGDAATAMQEGRVQDAAMLIDTQGMGKKAARNAERRAAAVQREAEMEEEKNPFEDVNVLKLLENGAWVGIGLLVLWEFYINSPFFDRAAPLIPVVYDEVSDIMPK